jgi:hypothetical protein
MGAGTVAALAQVARPLAGNSKVASRVGDLIHPEGAPRVRAATSEFATPIGRAKSQYFTAVGGRAAKAAAKRGAAADANPNLTLTVDGLLHHPVITPISPPVSPLSATQEKPKRNLSILKSLRQVKAKYSQVARLTQDGPNPTGALRVKMLGTPTKFQHLAMAWRAASVQASEPTA